MKRTLVFACAALVAAAACRKAADDLPAGRGSPAAARTAPAATAETVRPNAVGDNGSAVPAANGPGTTPPATTTPQREPPATTTPATPPLPVDVEPSDAPPLPAPLAAHLSRLSAGTGPQLVVQVDLRALAGADALREAARAALELLGPAAGALGDASCVVELVAAVEAVTYATQDVPDGPEMGIALADGDLELPAVVACIRTFAPELPAAADGDGLLAIAEHVALAAVGAHTLAFGSDVLVRRARAGVPDPLLESPSFTRARALAGPGPAYVVVFDDAGGAGNGAAQGGASLRTSPRLGLSGSLIFPDISTAGATIAKVAETLERLRRNRDGLLDGISGALSPAARGDLEAVLDAALDARLTLQGPRCSFEVWLPDGTDPGRLFAEALQLVPLLAALEGAGPS
jgi:hypothetical protein